MRRLVTLDAEGRLDCLGNWTAGQIFSHLAAWIEYGYDGYPINKPPLPIRWILRMMLPGMLRRGMKPGVRIPGVKDGTVGQEMMEAGKAAERLERAWSRLASGEPSRHDSPAFGAMSHERRIQLNLRHAELHLSNLKESPKRA